MAVLSVMGVVSCSKDQVQTESSDGVGGSAKEVDHGIFGQLVDFWGEPVRNARVKVDGSTFTAVTNDSGHYLIDYVPGQIMLVYECEGYSTAALDLNIATKARYPAENVRTIRVPFSRGMGFMTSTLNLPMAQGRIEVNSRVRKLGIIHEEWIFVYKASGDPVEISGSYASHFEAVLVDDQPDVKKGLVLLRANGDFLEVRKPDIGEAKTEVTLEIPEKVESLDHVGNVEIRRPTIYLPPGAYAYVGLQTGRLRNAPKTPLDYSHPVGDPVFLFEIEESDDKDSERMEAEQLVEGSIDAVMALIRSGYGGAWGDIGDFLNSVVYWEGAVTAYAELLSEPQLQELKNLASNSVVGNMAIVLGLEAVGAVKEESKDSNGFEISEAEKEVISGVFMDWAPGHEERVLKELENSAYRARLDAVGGAIRKVIRTVAAMKNAGMVLRMNNDRGSDEDSMIESVSIETGRARTIELPKIGSDYSVEFDLADDRLSVVYENEARVLKRRMSVPVSKLAIGEVSINRVNGGMFSGSFEVSVPCRSAGAVRIEIYQYEGVVFKGGSFKPSAEAVHFEDSLSFHCRTLEGARESVAVLARLIEFGISGLGSPDEIMESLEPWNGERYPETRQRRLTAEDIESWTFEELRYAINEMYARKGFAFGSKEFFAKFSKFDWYEPDSGLTSSDVEGRFSRIERENLEFLGARRNRLR